MVKPEMTWLLHVNFYTFKELKMLKKINKWKPHLNRVRRPGTSLEVHWLRRCTPNAGGLGSISGQGLYPTCCRRDSYVPQLRPGAAK